jgi:hypothetical protein
MDVTTGATVLVAGRQEGCNSDGGSTLILADKDVQELSRRHSALVSKRWKCSMDDAMPVAHCIIEHGGAGRGLPIKNHNQSSEANSQKPTPPASLSSLLPCYIESPSAMLGHKSLYNMSIL